MAADQEHSGGHLIVNDSTDDTEERYQEEKEMNLIVAVDQNWAIGKDNKLLVSIPADMKMFREETSGKVVVLGRKTLETFPNGLPLKNRTNIVITKNPDFDGKGAIVVHSIEEALEEVKKYPSEDVYCIGGDSIYKQMLPYCDTAHVTRIDFAYEADSYFPNLDEDEDWEITAESEEQTYFDLEYQFVKYERKKSVSYTHLTLPTICSV